MTTQTTDHAPGPKGPIGPKGPTGPVHPSMTRATEPLLEGPAMRAAFGALMVLAPMNDSQIPLAESATAVERLAALRELAGNVEARTDRWVARARDEGATWQQIGDALDTTRQAAQQRYGR